MLKKVTIYYACLNGGDGSVSVRWYLTPERAELEEENQDEGWGEDCTGSAETFEGSDIHLKAIENEEEED